MAVRSTDIGSGRWIASLDIQLQCGVLDSERLIVIGIIFNHEGGALELNLQMTVVSNDNTENLSSCQRWDPPLRPFGKLAPAINDSSFFCECPLSLDAEEADRM